MALAVDMLSNVRRADDPSAPDAGNGAAPIVDLGAYESASAPIAARPYVNRQAPANGIGTSWGTALTDLQPALSAALAAGGAVNEIWVAAGTYRPAMQAGDRTTTFRLFSGVGVLGGFGGAETATGQRDFSNPAHASILSGDLGADDAPNFGN